MRVKDKRGEMIVSDIDAFPLSGRREMKDRRCKKAVVKLDKRGLMRRIRILYYLG